MVCCKLGDRKTKGSLFFALRNKAVQANIKREQKKRKRLMQAANGLSTEDLVEVLAARVAAKAKAKAAPKPKAKAKAKG